jgi:methylthioribose-1-phosphate isomerase
MSEVEIRALEWIAGGEGDLPVVRMLDQTRLPHEEVYVTIKDHRDMADAISGMLVRGAPAIGMAAAYGVALAANRMAAEDAAAFVGALEPVLDQLAGTRPTAVNLFWALERMRNAAEVGLAEGADLPAIRDRLTTEARAIDRETWEADVALSEHGAALFEDGIRVLTHCNAGAIATGGYGTALGVIHAVHESGRDIRVWVDETRPRLQGARLTAWELERYGIPFTLISDNMAGHFMARGEIDAVIVGADRIASNGDTANKIGTYTTAVLAHEHGLPFYVAAPLSTVDRNLASGDQIPIEERDHGELTHIAGIPLSPAAATTANPAFDVTPQRYITAIITERGIARSPFEETLRAQFEARDTNRKDQKGP